MEIFKHTKANYDSLHKLFYTHTYKNKLGFKVKCYVTKKDGQYVIVQNENGCGVYLKRKNLEEI